MIDLIVFILIFLPLPWYTFKLYLLISGEDKIVVLKRALDKTDKRGKWVSMLWWPIVLNNIQKLK